MLLAQRFHHVGIAVSDLEASLAWYREMLDMAVEKRFTLPEAAVEIVKLISPTGVRIELLKSLGSAGSGRRQSGVMEPGAKHLCLGVDDIERVVEGARARGIRVVQEPQVIEASREKNAWIADLEGNLIELIEELGEAR